MELELEFTPTLRFQLILHFFYHNLIICFDGSIYPCHKYLFFIIFSLAQKTSPAPKVFFFFFVWVSISKKIILERVLAATINQYISSFFSHYSLMINSQENQGPTVASNTTISHFKEHNEILFCGLYYPYFIFKLTINDNRIDLDSVFSFKHIKNHNLTSPQTRLLSHTNRSSRSINSCDYFPGTSIMPVRWIST